ncbi:hypothetical protein IIA79_03705 [bacterium]|nr:hypothetical protein [bacterium]
MQFRTWLLFIVAVLLLILAPACQTVAMKGAKKYKVDLINALGRIQREIEQDGMTTEKNEQRLVKLLNKYAEEYSKKGSYIHATKIREMLITVRGEPGSAFRTNQEILREIGEVLEVLKTEVSY